MHFQTFCFWIHATVLRPDTELFFLSGGGGGALEPWEKAPNEKKHSLLTFKHFLFYFHDIFFPIFFPYVTPFGVKFHEKSIKKTCFLNKNCFHFLWKTG